MKWAKYLGQAIHDEMIEQSKNAVIEHEVMLERYNSLSKADKQLETPPEQPCLRMFYIPANSSNSAFTQALSDNNCCGTVFETEADTLASTFKQEWGNFSDILRKAFHHETTSMFRRKDNEYIEIKDPHIAIALSGTPKQVHSIFPDTENGLFSRFMFYAFEDENVFKNPFDRSNLSDFSEYFTKLGIKVQHLYKSLWLSQQKTDFSLTETQQELFMKEFQKIHSRNKLLLGRDFEANIKRLGLITFRIAMVFTGLRIMETGDISEKLVCSDDDFNNAMQICLCLEKHAIAVFRNLPKGNLKGIKQAFYEKLPSEFNRQTYLSIAKELSIKDKTAEKYVTLFRKANIITHAHNLYVKNSA